MTILKYQFDTRRDAEMSIERMVQEHGVDRADIFVAAAGEENSAGVERAGSDSAAGAPSEEPRDDAALKGAVMVAVKLEDEAMAEKVRSAFAEFTSGEVG